MTIIFFRIRERLVYFFHLFKQGLYVCCYKLISDRLCRSGPVANHPGRDRRPPRPPRGRCRLRLVRILRPEKEAGRAEQEGGHAGRAHEPQ